MLTCNSGTGPVPCNTGCDYPKCLERMQFVSSGSAGPMIPPVEITKAIRLLQRNGYDIYRDGVRLEPDCD